MIITFVTSNEYKIAEAKKLFSSTIHKIVPAKLDILELQEPDLEKIAISKAEQAWNIINSPLMVDDAGLFIDSLNGFPGTITSTVAKSIGISGLCKLINDNEPASFKAVVAYKDNDTLLVVQGTIKGKIKLDKHQDAKMFSDIFYPVNENKSLSELSAESFDSHRVIAMKELLKLLKTE